MTSYGRVIVVLLAACVPLLALIGCTGTDVLPSGSGELVFVGDPQNASGRFADNDFDRALIEIRQVEIRPMSADADASLGSANLGLLKTPFSANFVSDVTRTAVTPQTSGAYRVVRLVISRIRMQDVDDLTVAGLSDPVNPACQDFIKDANLDLQVPLYSILESDLAAPAVFSLDADNPGQLTMNLDYPGFLAAFNASLNCASCSCPGNYAPNVLPRNCSTSGASCSVDADCPAGQTCEDCTCPVTAVDFDRPTFRSLASTFVSFN